ncbi:MAG TPA: TadA family conjugal transfer-associated ATPase [Actinomycetaceae bacterium]|nr:TadA family conjugal transfer-associated ATPase [Actinomycetaceae bacterium]
MKIERVRDRVAGGSTLAHALAAEGGLSATTVVLERELAGARLLGAGEELQGLLTEPGVTDVVVHSGTVWVDRGDGMEDAGVSLGGEREVRALAVRLSALAGQRLDDAAPIVDGVLPSGVRLHAVLPPLAADGTSISLRTHHQQTLTLDELHRRGATGPLADAALRALVRGRANGVLAGATGTGKTTLLSALIGVVRPDERIVCIEEVRELEPDHPHVVHLQSRAANVQSAGAVGLDSLVRAALRMRPDRIVLGEARGSEVREVLTALNTGHAGSWFTLHANSVTDVPARLVALGALAGMAPGTIALQAGVALDVVVLLRREGGVRRVSQLAGLRADPGHGAGLAAVPVLEVARGTETPVRGAWERFAERWMG